MIKMNLSTSRSYREFNELMLETRITSLLDKTIPVNLFIFKAIAKRSLKYIFEASQLIYNLYNDSVQQVAHSTLRWLSNVSVHKS